MQAKLPHARSPKRLRHLKSHLRFIADFGLMDPVGLRW